MPTWPRLNYTQPFTHVLLFSQLFFLSRFRHMASFVPHFFILMSVHLAECPHGAAKKRTLSHKVCAKYNREQTKVSKNKTNKFSAEPNSFCALFPLSHITFSFPHQFFVGGFYFLRTFFVYVRPPCCVHVALHVCDASRLFGALFSTSVFASVCFRSSSKFLLCSSKMSI